MHVVHRLRLALRAGPARRDSHAAVAEQWRTAELPPSTHDQEDRAAMNAARPIYHWLKEHQEYFAGQQSEARVLLLGGGARGSGGPEEPYRSIFRLLTEEHILFGVVDNLDWIGKRDVD